jgi:uncharacterized protein (DUF1501 family)
MSADPEFPEILARLSRREPLTAATVSRRNFLVGSALATAGVAMASSNWFADAERTAWAAPPIGDNDGVLVMLMLGGGNDVLNTVVKASHPTYLDKRPTIRLVPDSVLPLADGMGLHPSLVKLKARYDLGQVAVVPDAGYQPPNLSHFSSTKLWFTATGSEQTPTGWLGRWLDGLGGTADVFHALTLGGSVPLSLIGAQRSATAIGLSAFDLGLGATAAGQRAYLELRNQAAGRTGLAASVADANGRAIDLADATKPFYSPTLTGASIVKQLELSARLINANLGIRVLNTSFGTFDTHSDQLAAHAARLKELDDAIDRFFSVLEAKWADRVTIVAFSEFGRTVGENKSLGTDHGAAGAMFVIGKRVKGGLHGAHPFDGPTDSNGRLRGATDFRAVYAEVLDRWLAADSTQVLGKAYPGLDLFSATPGPLPPPPTTTLPSTTTTAPAITTTTAPATTTTAPATTTTAPATTTTAPATTTTAPATTTAAPPATPAPTPAPTTTIVASAGPVPMGMSFVPSNPTRLLDTRGTQSRFSIQGMPTMRMKVAGVAGVPADASAAVLNVTVARAQSAGYLTVFPAGRTMPATSNINFAPDVVVPNSVVCDLGADGSIEFASSAGPVDLVVDLSGWFVSAPSTAAAGYRSVTPRRIADTREGIAFVRGAGPNEVAVLPVAGVGDVPADATAVVLNVTVTQPSDAGYLTVWPTGAAMPATSSVNWRRGETVPNLVVVSVGSGGSVSMFNSAGSTHLVADVFGYFAPGRGSAFHPAGPRRLVDSRIGLGGMSGPLPGRSMFQLPVGGLAGIPAGGNPTLVLNVTAVEPTASGYLTVFPSGSPRPGVSSLNVAAYKTAANMVYTQVGADGGVSVFNQAGETHLTVDLFGWFDAPT